MANTRIAIPQADQGARMDEQVFEMSVAQIGLEVRTCNKLEEHGIFTVRELLQMTIEDLADISNFSVKTIIKVYECLANSGVSSGIAAKCRKILGIIGDMDVGAFNGWIEKRRGQQPRKAK